ncbi:hypothetical protein [Mannheimia indoligenes]|uniref:hypothetical protein n=1 Tax=Mannheimia indoligenes TaxID=3103145 RepID=UPI002FE5DCC6
MEVVLIIIGVIFLFVLLSAKSGVGIKSSLIKEIQNQAYRGIGSPPKVYPSISLQEAYDVLSPYDADNRYGPDMSNYSSYSFWALVNNRPCLIDIKRENRGIKLLVTRGEDYNLILRSQGLKESNLPKNLRSI